MKTQIFSRIIAFFFIVFGSLYSYSKNIYVNDVKTSLDIYCTVAGLPSNDGLTPATPKATLKQAIGIAASGDVIYVDAGNYIDSKISELLLVVDNISIIGAGPSNTIFSQNSSGTLNYFMRIYNRKNLVLKNFQIGKFCNLTSFEGEAITIDNSENILFENIVISQNRSSIGEAAIVINDRSTVTFESISFSCQGVQSAQNGGGIDIKSSTDAFSTQVTVNINNSLIAGNDRTGGGIIGGGMIISGDASVFVNITNSTFYNNKAQVGGAIFMEGGVLNVNNTLFEGNVATGNSSNNSYGGAIIFSGTSKLNKSIIKNCKFIGNKSLNVYSSGGGAISFSGGKLVATDAGPMDPVSVDIIDCEFNNNTCANNKGTDIYSVEKYANSNQISISNCTLSSGVTSVYNTKGTLTLTGCNNPNPSTFGTVNMDLLSRTSSTTVNSPSTGGSCPTISVCNPAKATTTVAGCDGKATLTGTGPAGSIFYWYKKLSDATTHATNTSKLWEDTSSTASPNFLDSNITATKSYWVVSNLDGCVTPTEVVVTYNCPGCNPPTIPNFPTSACPKDTIKYITQSGQTNYVWTIPGVSGTDYEIIPPGKSTSDTLVLKWLTTGDKVVTVAYKDASNCTATSDITNKTSVGSLSTGVFTIQPSANSCQNTSIKYAANKTNTNFKWQITGVLNTDYEIVAGGEKTDDTLIIKWKTSGPHTVKLDYTIGVGGCATTTSATNTTQGVANPSTLSFASSDVTQPTCKDTTGSVKINLPYAGKWNVKAIHSTNSALTKDTVKTLLNTPPFTLIFDSLYTGSYTFQIIDSNGCVSPVSSKITIDTQPISPAKPVLDVNTIYCASNSYNTFSLDKIVFNPKPNSTETVKYLDGNNNTIPGQTLVDSTKKYKFLFYNGVCSSKDTLVTKISFDKGPLNVPAVLDISSTLICAVDKLDFNSLFTKIPATITSGFTLFISKDPSGNPIIPNTTYLPTNGGLLDSIYYTLANQNGCKNVKFGKLKFINNEGPTGLSLSVNQLFCGFSNPTVSKLDTLTAIQSITNTLNSLVWYASETATTPLPGNTPLVNNTIYFAAEKPSTGCESFVRKPIEAIIQVFGPTILNTANQSFCKNSTLTFSDLSISPYLYPDFVWLDAYKVPQLPTTKLIPGKYFAAEKLNGCISDKYQEIEVKFESPIITIAPTKLPTCGVGNGALKVVGGVTGYTYKWSKNGIPMTDIGDQISNLPSDYTIKYSVIVQDTKGCEEFDTTQFSDCEPPGIPHVLTLNKDGKNDVFKLYYHTKYPNCKLSIFNRWGAMVYESKDIPYKDDWDGKPNVSGTLGSGELPTGTYFYLIDKGDGSGLESGYIELVK